MCSLNTILKMKIENKILLYSYQPEIIIISVLASFSLQTDIVLCLSPAGSHAVCMFYNLFYPLTTT